MHDNKSQMIDPLSSNAYVSRVAAIVDAQIEELIIADLPKRRSLWLSLQSSRLAHQQALHDYTSAALSGRGDALDRALASRDVAAAALKRAQDDFDQSCPPKP